MDNAFCSPAAEQDISVRSSACSRQFKEEPFGTTTGSVSCLLRRKGI